MTSIEWAATAFGLACVILTIRQSIWCWPTGLVQVALYIFVFFEAKLYSDVVLHVIYVGMQIYGWWAWLHGGKGDSPLAVSRLPAARLAFWAGAGLLGTLAVGAAMHWYTDASRPVWDASVLALSLIAQWLMARKVLESWLFWIAVDVSAIGLYFVKGLYPTTGLYAVFLVLAILGFFEWQRTLPKPIPSATAPMEGHPQG